MNEPLFLCFLTLLNVISFRLDRRSTSGLIFFLYWIFEVPLAFALHKLVRGGGGNLLFLREVFWTPEIEFLFLRSLFAVDLVIGEGILHTLFIIINRLFFFGGGRTYLHLLICVLLYFAEGDVGYVPEFL